MKKEFCFIITLLLVNISWSQGQANIWYFNRNAGLDFNSGSPVALLDGQIDFGTQSSSISDANGNLLFYTDGETVWNKNHDVMPNGTSIPGFSSIQRNVSNLVIVHHNDNSNIYYIFFTVVNEIEGHDLRYAIVDLSLDNGLGDIVSKNILLNNNVSRSLNGVKHANGKDIWIVTHGFDNANFYAYKLTELDITTSPVISTIGEVMIPENGNNSSLELKFSLNGKKLAFTVVTNNNTSKVFDFEPLNGCVSNPKTIRDLETYTTIFGQITIHDHDVEFSPSGDFLYVSTDHSLFQYDLNAPILKDSKIQITDRFPDGDIRDLELGPDGKIYTALLNRSQFSPSPLTMSVIDNPNSKGLACNFVKDNIDLGGRRVTWLPNFIKSDLSNRIYYEGSCFGVTLYTKFSLDDPVDSVTWNFGDPNSVPHNNTSNQLEPTHYFESPGNYTVTANTITAGVTQQFTLEFEIFEPPTDIIIPEVDLKQCDDDTDGISVFNLNEAINKILPVRNNEFITFHESLTDAEQNLNPIINTTNYINKTPTTDNLWARVDNKADCYAISQIHLIVSTTQIPSSFKVLVYACDDNANGITTFDFSNAEIEIKNLFPTGQELNISYYKTVTDALSELNTIEVPTSYVNEDSPFNQDIFVRVDSKLNNDCLGLGNHIRLEVLELPYFELDSETTICINENPELVIPTKNATGNYTYEWTDSDGRIIGSESILTVNKGDIYSVTAKDNNECKTTHQIEVKEVIKLIPEENWFTIVNNSNNNSISIDTSFLGEGDFEFSLDNEFSNFQDLPFFENITEGEHQLFIRDKQYCGTSTPFEFSTFTILRFPKFFSPNNDGQNDNWNVIGFNRQLYKDAHIKIFDRYGKLLKNITPSSRGWDGTFNGRPLQPSDYWYVATITSIDNNTLSMTGHFTLKR